MQVEIPAREEYRWVGQPDKREAVVFRTDRFGQTWALEIEATHWVTYRVAAGLLEVSVVTIHNWVKDGKVKQRKRRNGVWVIALKEVERIAEARGILATSQRTRTRQIPSLAGR